MQAHGYLRSHCGARRRNEAPLGNQLKSTQTRIRPRGMRSVRAYPKQECALTARMRQRRGCAPNADAPGGLTAEVIGVLLGKMRPLFRQVVERENGRNRA